MPKIFISHSTADNAKAAAIAHWLQEKGFSYFIDYEHIAVGDTLSPRIESELRGCQGVLLLMSSSWWKGDWTKAEGLTAKVLYKKIFNVLIEEGIKTRPEFADYLWCNVVPTDGEEIVEVAVKRQQYVSETTVLFSAAGLRKLQAGLWKAELRPDSPPPWLPRRSGHDQVRSPYPGLKPLEAEDAAVFFGRQAHITEAMKKLHDMREGKRENKLLIVGASGAGKSSFLRAGLWPRLHRDDLNFLPLPIIRPRDAVISGDEGLAACLDRLFAERKQPLARGTIEKMLKEKSRDELLRRLQQLSQARITEGIAPPTLVISVDQAEELFRGSSDEVQPFMEFLQTALTTLGTSVLLIASLRSDVYERFDTDEIYEKLDKAKVFVSGDPYSLYALRPEDYKEVIEGPAQRHAESGEKLFIDPALTQILLNEAKGADALPMLAFTLESLYKGYHREETLRVEHYNMLGGVGGSITKAIEEAFNRHDPNIPSTEGERDGLLRQGFIPWLVRVDAHGEPDKEPEPVRRSALWEEIPSKARPLIDRFVERRLLTRSGDHVEVAHEALIRQWPKLQEWLREDGKALLALQEVMRDAHTWEKQGRSRGYLTHFAEMLSNASKHLSGRDDYKKLIGPVSLDFLEACRKEDSRRWWIRFWRAVLGVLVVITTALFLYTEWTKRTSEANDSWEQGITERDEKDDPLLASYYFARSAALRSRYENSAQVATSFLLQDVQLAQMSEASSRYQIPYSIAEGARVLSWTKEGAVSEWDALTGDWRDRFNLKTSLAGVAFDAKAETALLWDEASRVQLAEIQSGRVAWNPIPLDTRGKKLRDAKSLGSNRFLLLQEQAQKQTLAILEFSGSEASRTVELLSRHWAHKLTPDRRHLLAVIGDDAENGEIQVWALQSSSPQLKHQQRFDGRAPTAVISDDGKLFLTWEQIGADTEFTLWTVGDQRGKKLFSINGRVGGAQFSGNSRFFFFWGGDAVWRMPVSKDDAVPQIVARHLGIIEGVAQNPSGDRLLAWSAEGMARVWALTTFHPLSSPFPHESGVVGAAFKDASTIVTWTRDGVVRQWHTGQDINPPIVYGAGVGRASFVQGSHDVLAITDKQACIWNEARGQDCHMELEPFQSVELAPNGKRFLTISKKLITGWDIELRSRIGKVLHDEIVQGAALTSDGNMGVSWTDRCVHFWDWEKNLDKTCLIDITDSVTRALINGRRVFFFTKNKQAQRWTINNGKGKLELLRNLSHPILEASFDNDGGSVLFRSGGEIFEWPEGQAETKLVLGKSVLGQGVDGASESKDGRSVLVWSGGTAQIFSTLNEARGPALIHGGAKPIRGGMFYPSADAVLTWSTQGVRLWDLNTGDALTPLFPSVGQWCGSAHVSAEASCIGGIAVDPNGPAILAWTADGAVHLSRFPNVKQNTLHSQAIRLGACYDKDGKLQPLTRSQWQKLRDNTSWIQSIAVLFGYADLC